MKKIQIPKIFYIGLCTSLGLYSAVAQIPQDTLKPAPLDTLKPAPLDTLKPAPLDTLKPEPLDTLKPEPLDTLKPEPLDTLKPEPLDTLKPGPLDTLGHMPVDTLKSKKKRKKKRHYGAPATGVFYPGWLLSSTKKLESVDTLLRDFDLLTIPERTDFRYVNLGVLGTVTHQILYSPPEQIGARSGLSACRPHFVSPEEAPLYNLSDPLSSVRILFGDEDRADLSLRFARNIAPGWNFGVRFRQLNVDKQIGPRISDNRQIISTSYQLHTSAFTRDSTYASYLIFSRLQHQSFDQGGSKFLLEDPEAERFSYRNAIPNLQHAKGTTQYRALQTLHRLRLFPYTYFYLKGHTGKEAFDFQDNLVGVDSVFYRRHEISAHKTDEKLLFQEESLEGGLFWRQRRSSYRLYVGKRWVHYADNDSPQQPLLQEPYMGLAAEQPIPVIGLLHFSGKWLNTGHYKLEIGLKRRKLQGSTWITRYKPAFMEQLYVGNHHSWQRKYRSPKAAGVALKSHFYEVHKNIKLRGEGRFIGLQHYIFYDSTQMPTQFPPSRIVGLGESNLKGYLTFLRRNIVLEMDLYYRRFIGHSSRSFAFPKYQAQASLYYEGIWYENELQVQIGLRWRWRSAYFGFAYQPALQQFYSQNTFILRSYAPVDLFFRFKRKNFRIFAHFLHINHGDSDSYFTTPYYLGEPRFFDVGFSWRLFD